MLYTIPQLTLGGEDPNWQQVKWQAQDRSGQWEEEGDVRGREERALSHAAQRSESHLSAGLADRLID